MSQKDLKNCPVRVDDVKNAKVIFGPYRPGLKGWTTRKTPKRVSSERVHIPREYYKLKNCDNWSRCNVRGRGAIFCDAL